MYGDFKKQLQDTLAGLKEQKLYKNERTIASPQGPEITLANGKKLINMCANNYLGLADSPEIADAAKDAIDKYGFGLASVRFICGTQTLHKELEETLAKFLHTDDAILYSSCFDANGGLFETLLGPDDAVISDELNHASIIDGVRLCKAKRFRYRNGSLEDLEIQLKNASGLKVKMIATDGVFSMDGVIAPLDGICDLADKYGALVMVDDSHAAGFLGANGIGSIECRGVLGRVDIVTGTFGKALGGAGGGYAAGRREIIELLRQRSRPYLFSNTISPAVAGAALKALEIVRTRPEPRLKLAANAARFRNALEKLGFELAGADHPIIPVMLYDAPKAAAMAELLLDEGVYATGFSYPVVPMGKARIRTQVSAAHTFVEIDRAAAAFAAAREKLFA